MAVIFGLGMLLFIYFTVFKNNKCDCKMNEEVLRSLTKDELILLKKITDKELKKRIF